MARPRNKPPEIQTATKVYLGADNKWHAYVTMAKGQPRKHIQSVHETEARRLTFEAEQERDARETGQATGPELIASLQEIVTNGGQKPARSSMTGRAWFTYWLEEIAPYGRRKLAPRTLYDYESKLNTWVFPVLGDVELEDWTVGDLDGVYSRMREARKAESTIQKVHAIVRRGLKVARRRDEVSRNVAEQMDNPGEGSKSRSGLPEGAAVKVMDALRCHPNGLRWMVGFTGRRQGEAIALRWPFVDFEAGVVDMAWQVQRLTWKHGCADPVECAAAFCRRERCVPPWVHGCPLYDRHNCRKANGTLTKRAHGCPKRVRADKCTQHERACPEPCPPGCKKHATRCPKRCGGGLVFTRPKTFKPDQTEHLVAFPPAIMAALAERKTWQDEVQRPAAGDLWEEHHLVFCTDVGTPIDPRRDWEEWRGILATAKVPHQGTHSQRHTIGELLRDLGVSQADIQDLFLHADPRTTKRYTKRSTVQSRAVAVQIEGALFSDGNTTLRPTGT